MITSLPATKTEVTNIANILEKAALKVRTHLDNEATEDKIKALVNPSILHIATHGFFLEDAQISPDKSESLMGIRQNYLKNLPTNISSIKSYMPEKVDDDFLSFGNNNAKNLYLLLLEDL